MRVMERKYLYDDGLPFPRHRFGSELEVKMSVEVATKEYDRVKKTEDDLTKEIEQIKVKLKADHKMWVKECHDRLRSKVQRRVRKSVIRSNRQEASEQGWN